MWSGASISVFVTIVLALGVAPLPAWAQSGQTSEPTAQVPNSPQSPTAPDPSSEDAGTKSMFPHFKSTRYWLSGQANFIFQTHPPFSALYSGTHSLTPNYEKATSRILTLYTGVRLDSSTELLFAPKEVGAPPPASGSAWPATPISISAPTRFSGRRLMSAAP